MKKKVPQQDKILINVQGNQSQSLRSFGRELSNVSRI